MGRTALRYAILAAVGLILALAPVAGVHTMFTQQVADRTTSVSTGLADQMVHRAELAIDNALTTLTELALAGTSECTARNIELMRLAVYRSDYVKELGLLDENGRSLCNHIGLKQDLVSQSDRFQGRNAAVHLQAVSAEGVHNKSVMLSWEIGGGTSLQAVVAASALIADVMPANLHAGAVALLTLADGTILGATPPLGSVGLQHSMDSDSSITVRTSARYPVTITVFVSEHIIASEFATMRRFGLLGSVVSGAFVLGLLAHASRTGNDQINQIKRAIADGECIFKRNAMFLAIIFYIMQLRRFILNRGEDVTS